MEESLFVLMEATSPVLNARMKPNLNVLMELLNLHVLIVTNQFVQMELCWGDQHVRMEIDLLVLMAPVL